MKVVTIVGARPQFIKAATLSSYLKREFNDVIIHTGQHYDKGMSDVFFSQLKIPKPKYNLGIRSSSQGEQVGKMLIGIEKVLMKEKPRLVIVYGDTNSTLAGALAAVKLHIPIAHIEAGLRSFNRSMPEEINRVSVDHISDLLFCPTRTAVLNLKNENIKKGVYLVGDVMYDSICCYLSKAQDKSKILSKMKLARRGYYLLTIHRAENTSDLNRLKEILAYFDKLDLPVIFPIHPRTRKFIANSFKSRGNLVLTLPVSYLDMLMLEQNARAIITDSGGVQKEAYILKVPCFTLRNETEWVETLKYGCNRLIKNDAGGLSFTLRRLDRDLIRFKSNIYGRGNAAEKICAIIKRSISAA
ncbi:MAG TPA: UDP-N-acetylglucosamine 2-epimerase (non-hydrolyzing) [Candidatus Omnitrophica bacterium]|nr:UDP-N-acetylglucosamine 2-epimerase (non-hydrolyzing) [Candidatus Omnitrophota bacterium]